jgi:thioredoxin 1
MTTEVTLESFEDLKKKETVILDFWAEWCGPCRTFGPIFEKVAGELENNETVFGKVDTDTEGELASMFNVRSIPTVVVLKQGEVVFSKPGVLSESQLKETLKSL